MVRNLTERDYIISYKENEQEKTGYFTADLQNAVGILVVSSPDTHSLFFLRKKDRALQPIILQDCTETKSGEKLQMSIVSSYDPLKKFIKGVPDWLRLITYKLQADCTYFSFT